MDAFGKQCFFFVLLLTRPLLKFVSLHIGSNYLCTNLEMSSLPTPKHLAPSIFVCLLNIFSKESSLILVHTHTNRTSEHFIRKSEPVKKEVLSSDCVPDLFPPSLFPDIYQPPRVRQQQQQLFSSSYLQRVSPHYNTGGGGAYSEYVGSSINSRSNSVGSLHSSSNISNSSNSSGLFGGSTAINTSYQGSPMSGPRTSGSSTFTSNTSIPRTGGASNLARQATPEHRNQVPPASWSSPAGAGKKGRVWNKCSGWVVPKIYY